MNKIKILGLAISCCAIVSLTITSCNASANEQGHEHETSVYEVTSPLVKDTINYKEYVCQIHSINHIELRAQERGFLEKIYIDEGKSVKKGDLLFKIMPKIYEAEYERAQAEAEYARIEYLNTKILADSNVVSKNQLSLAEANYKKAKAALSLAEVHLNFTEIRAPFNGIIDRFHARLGSLIDEGDLLTHLSDNSQMWIYFNVPEVEYLNFKENAQEEKALKVKLLMANGKYFKYPGVVETIEADFNHETGNIAFRATFPNPEGLLRHGETGNIIMEEDLENAMLIPQKATYEILDRNYVFLLDDQNVLHAQPITIEAEFPHLYAIKEGLKPSDKILLDGLRKVKAGDKIQYKFKDPKEVISHLNLYAE